MLLLSAGFSGCAGGDETAPKSGSQSPASSSSSARRSSGSVPTPTQTQTPQQASEATLAEIDGPAPAETVPTYGSNANNFLTQSASIPGEAGGADDTTHEVAELGTPDAGLGLPPVVEMACVLPHLVYDDGLLGPYYLFDPQAQIRYAGRSATVTMSVDGFEGQRTETSRDYDDGTQFQAVDLSHKFYNTRTDEERFYGEGAVKEHLLRAVIIDEAGRTFESSCSFVLTYP
ncbi:hypothetical protein [Kineococcus rhizosphaerae]|nr:hypothetical protein [Kineococcus rhizosphaerae]